MKGDAYIRLYGCVLALDLTLTERVTLAYIIDNCKWGEGRYARTLEQFSEDLHIPAVTIRRIIASLEGAGYVDVERGNGRGISSVITLGKGCQNDTLFNAIKGIKMIPFSEKKGIKNAEKGCQNDTFSEKKEKRSKKEKRINQKDQKESVRNARTREDAEAIIREYDRKRLDPNGGEWTPTDEETAAYEQAKQVLRELDRAALVAEFKETMARYPDLAGWHQQPSVEQYALLIERYGREAVTEALEYTANRMDLKFQYNNPLAYVEQNIKNRRRPKQ